MVTTMEGWRFAMVENGAQFVMTGLEVKSFSVVCRQLGFSTPYTYYTGATYGQGCGPVFIDDLDCSGDEERLEHCFHRSVCSTNCDHSQDVAVYCYCKLPIITVFP